MHRPERDQYTLKDSITGITLFFSCYYVISANPTILASAGVPHSSALLGTLLVIIIGNITGALATNTGLIIAPAIGISAFFASYIENTDLNWTQGLVISTVAGLLIMATSFFSNWRSVIVDQLPLPIVIGIKATIGALLVDTSFTLMTTVIDQGLIDKQFIIMVMGAAILITLTMISLRKHYQSTQGPSWLVTLLSLEHLITVAFVTLMLYLFKPEFIAQFQQVSELSFVLANPELLETHFTFAQLMSSVPLMLTLWFIVVTDIPGTPPVVLPKTMLEKNREVYENRGFKNDSVFTFISPLLGTTPTIYYAENQLLNEGNRYNKGIGLTVAGLFLLCLLALIGAQYSGYYTVNLDRIIPPLAVAPVLFYIGLFVIASSFINDSDIDKQDKHQGDFRFYLPAALAVVLTPFVGPQYSFPITILSYWITGAHFQKKAHPSFILISCGAIFTLLIYVSLLFLK